jgi:hypothetical protein
MGIVMRTVGLVVGTGRGGMTRRGGGAGDASASPPGSEGPAEEPDDPEGPALAAPAAPDAALPLAAGPALSHAGSAATRTSAPSDGSETGRAMGARGYQDEIRRAFS